MELISKPLDKTKTIFELRVSFEITQKQNIFIFLLHILISKFAKNELNLESLRSIYCLKILRLKKAIRFYVNVIEL